MSFLHNVLSIVVTKIKGEQFILDKNIPIGYLFSFFIQKAYCLIIGIFKLHRMGKYFIHPTTKIKCISKVRTGKNLNIDRRCYIDALSINGINFGNNVSIGKNTTIECSGSLKNLGKGLTVGENVGLGTHGFFGCAGGIEIGDNTIFGNYVSLHSENHNYSDNTQPIRLQGINRKGVKIGDDCWIGAKVTILDGTVLGNGCVVAAGAVVRGKFPENVIIGGVPAKIIKQRFNEL
ncbi:MAG: acyltransferase [Coprobacter fastidiosus]|nr:MAG: acyltransferase [Coprobacter fastidiosus]